MSAEDKASGNKQQIVIRNDQKSMKPEDIERMVNDAEKFKEADKQVRSVWYELRSEMRYYRALMCYSCYDVTYVRQQWFSPEIYGICITNAHQWEWPSGRYFDTQAMRHASMMPRRQCIVSQFALS